MSSDASCRWATPSGWCLCRLGVSAFVKGGSIDVPGYHALCVPGAMLFDDRWVYFCLTINWNAAAETDPKTVGAFAAAASRALTLVKQALSA